MGKDKGGKGGVVVNIASTLGLAPIAGCPVYAGTKHAVVGITRSFGVSMPKNNGHFTPELLTTFSTSLFRRTGIVTCSLFLKERHVLILFTHEMVRKISAPKSDDMRES
jgi:hypothetical protein